MYSAAIEALARYDFVPYESIILVSTQWHVSGMDVVRDIQKAKRRPEHGKERQAQ